MNTVLKLTKKAFTVGVVFTTILWSVGVAALVPGVANAATCPTLSAGEMVKVVGLRTIYVLNNNSQLMAFPTGDDFKSWNVDNSYSGKYTSISQACYDSLSTATVSPFFVGYRAGSYLVKRESSSKLYVVEPNNVLVPITEDAAKALYGSNYKAMTVAVPHWSSTYTVKPDTDQITEAKAHPGMLVKNGGKTWYVDTDNKLREVSAAGMTANRFKAAFVRTVADSAVAGLSVGEAITAEVTALTDRTQTGLVAGTPVVVGVTGSLTLSLSADSPAGKTVPLGATNIDVLKLNAVNSGTTDAVLDELIVKRAGVGAVTGLTIYLYDGETRVGSGKTFASDTNEAVFSAINLTVKSGTTRALTLRLKTTSSSTGDSSFSVTSAKLVAGTVGGSMPLMGATFTMGTATAGSITIAGNGTLSTPVIGDVGASVAQFKLTAGTEDVDVYSFTLKQDGTLDTSLLSNFTLYQGATLVPATVSVSGRLVTFALTSPLRIVNGGNKILTVKADISATAETAKTVVFFMDNDNDLKAVGASYGYGVSLTRSSYDAAASGEGQSMSLLGGGVTIANKSASAHDVKTDSTEVELGKVAITAKSDTIEIQKMTVNIETTEVASGGFDYGVIKDDTGGNYTATSTLLLRNIKLKDVDTGRTVGSAQAVTDCGITTSVDEDTTLTCTYVDYFTVAKGTTRNIALVADINSAQISGVKHTASFDFSSASVFVVKDSKDVTVTDIVPAASIASNQVTTRSSALTISRATTPETRTVVKNSVVDALGMIFAAGSGTGNDVKVTGLTLNVYVDDITTADGTFVDTTDGTVDANELVTYVSIYDGETLVAGPVSVDSSGNAVFSSSKFVGGYYPVAAGASKNLVARATVSGNAPYGGNDDRFSFTFAATDVTCEDGAGTTFVPTVTDTDINGTGSPSVYIQITGGGTITTAADNGKPLAKVLLAGTASEQEVHRIKLTTTKETFTVDKLAVGVSSAATTYDNVQYLRLYDTNGNALSEAVNLGSTGTSTFTGLNIQVPVAGTVVVVKAKLNAIGERTVATVAAGAAAGVGADTGDALTFALSTVSDDFHAQGGSGTVDIVADAAASNSYQVVKSKPTVAVVALPSAVLSAGTVTIFKFTVTADANEDVTLARVTPHIVFSDSDGGNELVMSASSLKLYDMDNASTVLGTGTSTAVSSTANYEINLTSTTLPVVAKGTTKTFEIRATFTGVETNDSVSVDLPQDSAALTGVVRTGDGATVQDTNKLFVWSDNSADTDDFTSTEWMNSYLLPNWDTTSKTVSKS